MNKEIRVKAEHIRKEFQTSSDDRSSIKEFFLTPFKKVEHKNFVALEDISFEINDGDFFGIIGRNGSGKSTLLKMLAGIYDPTRGKILINGKMVPFLELGVGFNMDLNAKENIYLNGTILGLTKKEIDKKFEEILEFAEVKEFKDLQLKHYSSGMTVRLAFSIAIHVPAEIYIMDEVLAVGDINFQEKCLMVFERFKKEGKTIIFVSHDLNSVERFCNRAILIEDHKILDQGAPKKVIKTYTDLMARS